MGKGEKKKEIKDEVVHDGRRYKVIVTKDGNLEVIKKEKK